jgi:hypothetical protein
MFSNLSRQLCFYWRERYLRLMTWLSRLESKPESNAAEALPPAADAYWLDRLKQHLKQPPNP